MTREVVTVVPDATVADALDLIGLHQIRHLPVVESHRLVGIASDREPHSRIEVLTPDRPGELARVVRLIGIDHGINITGVVVPPSKGDRSLIVLHLESASVDDLVENLRRIGYESGSPALEARPE